MISTSAPRYLLMGANAAGPPEQGDFIIITDS